MNSSKRSKWLPMPMHSALLFIVWLLLNNTVDPGHLVLAAILAWTIPLFTASLQSPHPSVSKPSKCIKYVLRVVGDIVMANFEVAYRVLGPAKRLHPAFVAVPIEIQREFPITVLASTVSLTPGTVSAEVSEDRRWLYVHVLNLEDEKALIELIKHRYETPLREIFEC